MSNAIAMMRREHRPLLDRSAVSQIEFNRVKDMLLAMSEQAMPPADGPANMPWAPLPPAA